LPRPLDRKFQIFLARFSPASTLLELGDWQRTDYRCFAHPEKDGGLNLGSSATNAVFHHAEDGDGSLRESEDILKGFGSSGLTDPDSVPQVTDQPVTRLGDIWLLGDHLRPAKAGNRLPANRKTSANMDLPRFRGEMRAWDQAPGFTSCCPPVSWDSLVRPPAEPFFRPDPRTDAAAARSGGQGRPLPAAARRACP